MVEDTDGARLVCWTVPRMPSNTLSSEHAWEHADTHFDTTTAASTGHIIYRAIRSQFIPVCSVFSYQEALAMGHVSTFLSQTEALIFGCSEHGLDGGPRRSPFGAAT